MNDFTVNTPSLNHLSDNQSSQIEIDNYIQYEINLQEYYNNLALSCFDFLINDDYFTYDSSEINFFYGRKNLQKCIDAESIPKDDATTIIDLSTRINSESLSADHLFNINYLSEYMIENNSKALDADVKGMEAYLDSVEEDNNKFFNNNLPSNKK